MVVKLLLCVPVFWIVAIIFFNMPSKVGLTHPPTT